MPVRLEVALLTIINNDNIEHHIRGVLGHLHPVAYCLFNLLGSRMIIFVFLGAG